MICITALPPGPIVTGAASTVAPADATCGWISAVQVPAPSPPSEIVTGIAFEFAPPPATR